MLRKVGNSECKNRVSEKPHVLGYCKRKVKNTGQGSCVSPIIFHLGEDWSYVGVRQALDFLKTSETFLKNNLLWN